MARLATSRSKRSLRSGKSATRIITPGLCRRAEREIKSGAPLPSTQHNEPSLTVGLMPRGYPKEKGRRGINPQRPFRTLNYSVPSGTILVFRTLHIRGRLFGARFLVQGRRFQRHPAKSINARKPIIVEGRVNHAAVSGRMVETFLVGHDADVRQAAEENQRAKL